MTKHSPDAKPERLLPLHEKIGRIVQGLARPTFAPISPSPEHSSLVMDALEVSKGAVSGAIRSWRERSNYLPGELFSDPAWGMLLELLQAEIEQRRVSLPRLCNISAISATSLARWLKALENRELIIRRADPHDARNEFVELSPKASAALRRYFRDVANDGGV